MAILYISQENCQFAMGHSHTPDMSAAVWIMFWKHMLHAFTAYAFNIF